MNSCQFTGTIRDSFGRFSELRFVDYSRNNLVGSIPTSLFELPLLEIVYLFENRLSSSIPENFGNSPFLRDFYIYSNVLLGTVPSIQPGQLPVFTEFRLENNQIGGTMPASICALRGPNNETDLVSLTADCAGNPPEIQCDCCTACV